MAKRLSAEQSKVSKKKHVSRSNGAAKNDHATPLPKMVLKYNVECFFNYTVCYLGAKVALVIGKNDEHLPSLETPTSVVLVATK